MRYGYARVSTEDQSLDIQIADLRGHGCVDIRSEKMSGGTIEKRDEFTKLIKELKAGDELWVVRIDRFARSLRDLAVTVEDLVKRGITLKATQQPIDTASASGRAFLQMLGVFAEFERSITAERRAAGIVAAKAAGKYAKCGRPSRTTKIDAVAARARKDEIGAARAALEYGVSPETFYRIVRRAA